jgi:hypothetical protein
MAFFVTGSPMIVQLHCKGPTGKVSRISKGFAGSMDVPVKLMAHFWHSAKSDGDV